MVVSSFIKIISAFLAGLILVMGSALIYSRTRELMYPIRVAQAVPGPELEGAPEPQALGGENKKVVDSSQAPSTPEPQISPLPSHAAKRQYRRSVFEGAYQPGPLIAHALPRAEIVQKTASTVIPSRLALASAPAITYQSTAPAGPQALAETSAPVPQQTRNNASQQYPTVHQPAPQASVQPVPVPREPQVVTLQPGTQLTIKLIETLSTDRNLIGDTFRGTLESPVTANGFIIAERGSLVSGRIVSLERAKLMSGVSALTLQLSEINTTDGQRIRVETTPWGKTGAKLRLQNTPRMAVGAAFGAVVGALSGAARGAGISDGFGEDSGTANVNSRNQRTVVVPMESRLSFSLTRPVTITERLNYR